MKRLFIPRTKLRYLTTAEKITLLMDYCGYQQGPSGRDSYVWKKVPDKPGWIERIRYEAPETKELCDDIGRVRASQKIPFMLMDANKIKDVENNVRGGLNE